MTSRIGSPHDGASSSHANGSNGGNGSRVAAENSVSKPTPAWYTPARLLIAFCIVETLVFLDRGVIASNGVNGDKDSATGIQVSWYLALVISIVSEKRQQLPACKGSVHEPLQNERACMHAYMALQIHIVFMKCTAMPLLQPSGDCKHAGYRESSI